MTAAAAYEELQSQRSALNAAELAQMERLTDVWTDIVVNLRKDIDKIGADIAKRVKAGEVVSENVLRQMEHYQALLRNATQQATFYAQAVQDDVALSVVATANAGVEGAVTTTQLAAGNQPLVLAFDQIDVSGVTILAGLLADGTPIRDILMSRWPETWASIEREMLRGAAKGLSPREIAKAIVDKFGAIMADVLRIVRTENMRAYREATRQTYIQSGVVKQYKRVATKDTRTCIACIALDGRVYPVTQPLVDHPMGRCAMIPIVTGAPEAQWQKGSDWFETLDEADQRAMMGDAKYQAWVDGQFDFEDLAVQLPDSVWGGQLRTATADDLGIDE